jgi:hypothetical protein
MSLRSTCSALARSGAGTILALAAASGAHASLTGVSAEITLITFGGSPHAIVDVHANFSQANDNLLSAFNWQGAFTPSSALKHFDPFNGTWDPKFWLPSGGNPTDSSVRIGGAFDFNNATAADPSTTTLPRSLRG